MEKLCKDLKFSDVYLLACQLYRFPRSPMILLRMTMTRLTFDRFTVLPVEELSVPQKIILAVLVLHMKSTLGVSSYMMSLKNFDYTHCVAVLLR